MDRKSKVSLEGILRKIHFADLEVFDSVSRLGSISGAARELKLLAPHVSKSIKRIEIAARSTFFQRSKTGVALTADGRKFLEFSQSFSKFILASKSFDPAAAEVSQKLVTLTGPSYLVQHLLCPAINAIKPNEDRYRFRLVEQGESQVAEGSLKRLFDIAIHSSQLDLPKSWVTTSIGNFSWKLFARVGHPLGSVANERDVKKYAFVKPMIFSNGAFRSGEDRCPLASKYRLAGDEVQTAETGLQLVAKSDQLIYAPELIARSALKTGILQAVQVRQWHSVRETLSLSAQGEQVPQRLFEQLLRHCEEIARTH
jgi:DNA-binding transcriptional LysR family regulator